MKIVKFRVWNYKSIVDTGDCYPTRGVTIFAGKNESGKTSILEALEDFNMGTLIREKAIPIGKKDAKPKISVTYKVPVKVIQGIYDQIEISSRTFPRDSVDITVTKFFPEEYNLSNESASFLRLRDEVSKELIDDLETAVEKARTMNDSYSSALGTEPLPEVPVTDYAALKVLFTKYNSDIGPNLGNLPESEGHILSGSLATILELCDTATRMESQISLFANELMKNIPNFILFSSFNDIFPNIIPITDLGENQ